MKQAVVGSLHSLLTADYTLLLTLLVLIPCLLEAFTVLKYTPGQNKPHEKLKDLHTDRVPDELGHAEDTEAGARLGHKVNAESGSSEERITLGDDDDFSMTSKGVRNPAYKTHFVEEKDKVYGPHSTQGEADSKLRDQHEFPTYTQSDVIDDRDYYHNADIDMFEPVNAGMQDDEYVDEETTL